MWARIALIPFRFSAPLIILFSVIGAFSIRYMLFDVWVALIFGGIGYVMRKFGFPIAPLVLATVLGPDVGDVASAVPVDFSRIAADLLYPADCRLFHGLGLLVDHPRHLGPD